MSTRSDERTAKDWLLARLAAVEREVAAAVARRGHPANGSGADEPHGQGLFISPADVAALLEGPDGASDERPASLVVECCDPGLDAADADADPDEDVDAGGGADRCVALCRVFGLEALDLAILLVALAPDVDRRFENLYAYLNDDVTCRRPTVGLCLELCGASPTSPWVRARLRPDAPLRRLRLIEVDDRPPFAGRTLRVHDRVVDHLLGGDLPDAEIQPLVLPPLTVVPGYAALVDAALEHGVHLVYLRSRQGQIDHAGAAGALDRLGINVLQVDLGGIGPQDDVIDMAASVAREAGLHRSALVAGPIDELAARHHRAIDVLSRTPGPVVLLGSRAWEPGWCDDAPMIVDVDTPDFAAASEVWARLLGTDDLPPELTDATATFRLTPHQVLRAAAAAGAHASGRAGKVDAEAVRAGARAQNGGGLETLARRLHPRATVEDLILPEVTLAQVLETASRARLRHRVVGEWKMRGVGIRGDGITALFAGASGTGKTLAAEVIAGSLGLDLYVVDLSSVVDKYIGETEKNLERIFSGAQGLNGVLFFDEADALFGKRSAVSDGHDRYANIEVAYLLQRMEQFDGISVLATNLTANLDDAFARRIDVRVVFPQPDAPERRRLWARHLPPSLPVTDDVDLDFLAGAFRLAGGDIRNVTLAAAFEAASRDESVGMAHLVRATAREYRKLGRLCTEEDFGPYMDVISV